MSAPKPMKYCSNPIKSRSRFAKLANHRCFKFAGHAGECEEYPYLAHLWTVARKVADKIVRDATNTTGAAWASEDAGPNRILRWAMLLPDNDLLPYGLKMSSLKPGVVAKLREKGAGYEACMEVAQKLTALVYGMDNAPTPPDEIREYLAKAVREPYGRTTCQVCRLPLDFNLFAAARRGKAELETAHANPRLHTAENVGFAHRECNIAQGSRTLQEFYQWISDILQRVRAG